MRKNVYLWLCALVLTMAGLSSCSSDDDSSLNGLTGTWDNELLGAWEMVSATYGFGGDQEFQAGEVVVIFDYKQLIVTNKDVTSFLKSGKYPYTTLTELSRILTNQWVDVKNKVVIIKNSDEVWGNRELKYTYWFRDGMLVLDGGIACDGPGFFFRKYQPTCVPLNGLSLTKSDPL